MAHKSHLTTGEKIAQGWKDDQVVLRVPIHMKLALEEFADSKGIPMNTVANKAIASAIGYNYVPEKSTRKGKYSSPEAAKEAAKVRTALAREHVKDIKALMADADAAAAIKALLDSLAARKAK